MSCNRRGAGEFLKLLGKFYVGQETPTGHVCQVREVQVQTRSYTVHSVVNSLCTVRELNYTGRNNFDVIAMTTSEATGA